MTDPDRALRILLLIALTGVFFLFSPFLTTLVLASVTTVLVWPIQRQLSLWLKGRGFATVLTMLCLTLGVLGPVTSILFLVSRELQQILGGLVEAIQAGAVDRLVAQVLGNPWVQQAVDWSGDANLGGTLRDSAQQTAMGMAGAITQRLPNLVSGTARLSLDLVIYYMTIATLLYEGPSFLAWGLRISPLRQEHTRRMFEVFAEFARNVVLAGLFTGALQGVVAGIGYWIFEVDRPLLLSLLTGVLAYVPVVGTALVWVPLTLAALAQGAWGQAAGLMVWSLLFTTSVDNFVKPLLVRGRSNVPPVLIFLGVFGGLSWLGLIGVLVGPVAVAVLLALLQIYEESLSPAP